MSRAGFPDLKRAVDTDDAGQAVAVARSLVPDKRSELDRFAAAFAAYEAAGRSSEWRAALRHLATARSEAIAAGLTELERLVTYRLFKVVQQHREGLKA